MKAIRILFALVIALGLALSGCKKEEKKAEPAPPAAAKEEPKKEEPAKEPAAAAEPGEAEYIKAAIEIGCLGKTLEDKTQMPAKAMEIQKKYNFKPETWVEMAQKYGTNPEVGKKIVEGMKDCK
ncbi:MAG: hypothetical protein JXR96_10650 [Deltaproteobacteria bacterium]|nr:hypothetical protein [Deltaproteobacteria bacterium]